MFKVNKNTRMTSLYGSIAFIVDLEQVSASWETGSPFCFSVEISCTKITMHSCNLVPGIISPKSLVIEILIFRTALMMVMVQ